MIEGGPQAAEKMRETIGRMEKYALHLRSLGEAVQAVEKNADNILSTVYLLKLGTSDIVEIRNAQGGTE